MSNQKTIESRTTIKPSCDYLGRWAVIAAFAFIVAHLDCSTGWAANDATPNRTILQSTELKLGFAVPDAPSENDVNRVRLFAEMLIAVGGKPSLEDNRIVFEALNAFEKRPVPDDFTSLELFVTKNPNSPWTPSVTFSLGLEYYTTGWYSKALTALERAWPLLKDATDPQGKALGDRAAGELAKMYGRLGRMQNLGALLQSIQGRPILGSAREKIAGAEEDLWTMQSRPEIAFQCGPVALARILAKLDPSRAEEPIIKDCKSTTNGCSLSQVAELSKRLGLNYQMAYRSNNAPLLIPAVVNCKVGHYAALMREENGLYLLQDAALGNETWMTRRALEAETSGYFLVPPGKLPHGWRTVTEAEGLRVFGKGATTSSDGNSTSQNDQTTCSAPSPTGMAVHSVHLMLVSLHIQDSPVGYTPPVGGPVRLLLTYNQREISQPANFNFVNLGQKWMFNWLAYINDNPNTPSGDVYYFPPGGGILPFTSYNSSSQTFAPQQKSQAILKRTSATSYSMLYADGSVQIFDLPDSTNVSSRRVFMRAVIDPQGNTNQIVYDGSFRITGVKDAIGQTTTFAYTNLADPLKITQVSDPFGRSAYFTYDTSNRLSQITDAIGLTSQFTYDSANYIQTMVTPYGTNSFAYGGGRPGNVWLETTYPNGEKDRVEYSESQSVAISDTDPPATVPIGMPTKNAYLSFRNTYYWDRKAYSSYSPTDFTKARIYRWLHSTPPNGPTSGILTSTKEPLENRVWLFDDGQTSTIVAGSSNQPRYVGRVLDDGSTQLYQFLHNALGNVTNSIDPLGRSMTYLYSTNLVDLLEARQTTGANNELVAKFLYNPQHLVTAAWDAAGKMTTNTYNPRGQLLTTKNLKGETTTLNYETNGYLLSIDGPLSGTNDSIGFSYDPVGRVKTVTDMDGYKLTFGYDNFDRLTNITYLDGTFEAFTFDKLDRAKSRDRMGRETRLVYDSLRRLTSVQDPLNRTNYFTYCGCGSLASLIDAMGRQTTWEHDIEGRVTAKQYADGSRITYNYENSTSRLKSVQDEKGQFKIFSYNLDNNLNRILYANAQIPTPTVHFAYDTNYNRLVSMQDGIGTTSWKYFPVGVLGALRVSEVDGPWPNEAVTYAYDELRRLTNRAINGIAQTFSYDPLWRVTNVVNALGSFGYSYDGATARIQDVAYPNGQKSHYDYFDNLGDRRLQRITHSKPDTSLISRFTYAYNPVGNITNWLQEMNVLMETWSIGYDDADQLLSVVDNQGGTNTLTFGYGYDPAGNQLFESTNGTQRSFQYNALDELVSSSDGSATNISYEWDGEQRLTAMNAGTNRSEFSYDGLGRRVKIVEKVNGVSVSEKRFVWCGTEMCQERTSNDSLSKQYLSQGAVLPSGSMFYTRDHLGSIREITDSPPTIRSQYRYGAYGSSIKLGGDIEPDFGFTGQYHHYTSGLNLALYRAYDTGPGRWLSRDPFGESTGANFYGYVLNNPLNFVDPLGLDAIAIEYRNYPVNTGFGFTFPLGHGGIVSVDPKTGRTRYYEYGRYDPAQRGIVRREPIPNLVIGPNGQPTEQSLKDLYDYLSSHYGKHSLVEPTFYSDADFDKVNSCAEGVKNNPNRPDYSIFSNNCKTFRDQCITEGRSQ